MTHVTPDSVRDRLSVGYARSLAKDKLQDANLHARLVAIGEHLPDGNSNIEITSLFTAVASVRDALAHAMHRAVDTGDAQVIRATSLEIAALFDVMEAQAIAPAPASIAKPLAESTIEAVEEMTEAVSALTKAGTLRSPLAIENAMKEVREAIPPMIAFVKSGGRMVNQRQQHAG